MRFLVATLWRSQDRFAFAIIALVVAVSGWILAMPISQSIQSATLARFHLCTPNYWAWSAQQLIPSMYNFENRYWWFAGSTPLEQRGEGTPGIDGQWIETRVVNHFPGRLLTFGDSRHRLLGTGESCHLVLRSRYRGNELATVWNATVSPLGGFDLSRVTVVKE